MVKFYFEKSILKNLFEQNFYFVRTIKFFRTKKLKFEIILKFLFEQNFKLISNKILKIWNFKLKYNIVYLD